MQFLEYIAENKEWIFSGIGVTILITIWGIAKKRSAEISFFLKKLKRKLKNLRRKTKNALISPDKIDLSEFVSEYPPDGDTVQVGTSFQKEWTIRNAGNVTWKGRYMHCVQCMNKSFFPKQMTVKMPTVEPNETYTLKATYFAAEEGDFRSRWKMYNADGSLSFPEKELGLGLNVSVTSKKELVQK